MSSPPPVAALRDPSVLLRDLTRLPSGMQVGMLTLGAYTIRVGVKAGRHDRPPLLIFNGLGGNLELLEPLVRELGDVGVIAFDIPGVGRSKMPSRPYRLGEMARLARELVLWLGHDHMDVLGVSWGGALAQEYVRRYQASCRRLILAATTTGMIMVPGKLHSVLRMVTPTRYADRDFLRGVVGEIYGGVFRSQPEIASGVLRHVRWPSSLGYYLQLMAVLGWTSVHWLHRLKLPTLVMSGNDDPIVRPINARLQAYLLPQSTWWRVDCGHLFFLTRAKESAAAIREFLQY